MKGGEQSREGEKVGDVLGSCERPALRALRIIPL